MPLLPKIIILKLKMWGIFFLPIWNAMFVSRSFTSPQVKTLVCALAPAEANPAEMFHMWGNPLHTH